VIVDGDGDGCPARGLYGGDGCCWGRGVVERSARKVCGSDSAESHT
jgi:hypothetical protein